MIFVGFAHIQEEGVTIACALVSGNFSSYLRILLTTEFSLGSQNKPLYPLELLLSLTADSLS